MAKKTVAYRARRKRARDKRWIMKRLTAALGRERAEETRPAMETLFARDWRKLLGAKS